MDEADSPLHAFLAQHRQEGESVDEGAFTLNRAKALEKLAGFQLENPTDWLPKLVQAAVSAAAKEIEVETTSSDLRVRFEAPNTWTEAELEEAFFAPEKRRSRSLNNLVQALWTVAGQGRAFCFCFPQATSATIWYQGEFTTEPLRKPVERFFVSVSHQSANGKAGPSGRELLDRLKGRAYCCPVPLTVNGRRLDMLQNSPEVGFGSEVHPLAVGIENGRLPTLDLPPGSLEEKLLARFENRLSSLHELSQNATRALPAAGAGLAWMLSYQEKAREPVLCHFVRDGVICETIRFRLKPGSLAFHLWVSAAGLETDASGFKLLDTPEKHRRIRLAAHLGRAGLLSVSPPEPKVSKGVHLAKAVLLVGMGTMFVAPAVGLVTGGLGILAAGMADRGNHIQNQIGEELESLKRDWAGLLSRL